MQLYSENEQYKLYHGNMLDMLNYIEGGVIDSIVTDPPYELNFMGKGWDNSGIAFQKDTWEKCLKVLKPGGYLLAFGGSRTYHRIACAIEDAGFEIRDCIMWLYGSGFPKSMNIGLAIDKKNGVDNRTGRIVHHAQKGVAIAETRGAIGGGAFGEARDVEERKATNEWAGWGTALKPSYEPIIVARKPLEGSCTDNVIKYGVGGINIDECRVPFEDTKNPATNPLYRKNAGYKLPEKGQESKGAVSFTSSKNETSDLGRFPANTILTYGEEDKEEVCSGFPNSKGASSQNNYSNGHIYRGQSLQESKTSLNGFRERYNDEGSAARYFYCAKASRRDRDEGLGTETIIDIILADKNGKIWKGENIIRDEKSVNADIEAYLKSDTGEYEILNKEDLDLSIILYMKNIIEKYLNECKSTTKMGINSTTIYQILNWLIHLNTKENTLDVKQYDEKYISHVENAENGNLFEITIKEKSELVHDVNNAVLKMQLRIKEKEKHSTHPTVKPTDLMQYLVRLVTPNGGTVLDPFNGSGSTGKAVMYENKDRNKNYKYIGIELTDEYLPIAKARIDYAINSVEENQEENKQPTLFDI